MKATKLSLQKDTVRVMGVKTAIRTGSVLEVGNDESVLVSMLRNPRQSIMTGVCITATCTTVVAR